jgi:hypothetical protein
MALLAELQLDAVGGAVSRQQHGLGLDLIGLKNAARAGGVHAGQHVGIVDQVPENGQRSLPAQAQRQVDGITDAEAHAIMFRHPDLHSALLGLRSVVQNL